MIDLSSLIKGIISQKKPSPLAKDDTPRAVGSLPISHTEKIEKSPQGSPQTPIQPAIRTMKSDVEMLFKTSPPSIAQMITKPGMTQTAKKHFRFALVYVVSGVAILLGLTLGYAAYYYRDTLFPPAPETLIKKAVPPAPFFATESSRTLEVPQKSRDKFVQLMRDSMQEFERDGTIKRILVKFPDTPEGRFADVADVFDAFRIMPPENFLKRLMPGSQMFVYTMGGTRFGLAVRTSDPIRTMRDMLDWEKTMLVDMKPLFFGQQLNPVTATFEDRTYRNIDWRYFKLSDTIDIGLGYTIFPAGNILVITTSKAAMETVINRLFDAR